MQHVSRSNFSKLPDPSHFSAKGQIYIAYFLGGGGNGVVLEAARAQRSRVQIESITCLRTPKVVQGVTYTRLKTLPDERNQAKNENSGDRVITAFGAATAAASSGRFREDYN